MNVAQHAKIDEIIDEIDSSNLTGKQPLMAAFTAGVEHGKAQILERAHEMLGERVSTEKAASIEASIRELGEWCRAAPRALRSYSIMPGAWSTKTVCPDPDRRCVAVFVYSVGEDARRTEGSDECEALALAVAWIRTLPADEVRAEQP